MPIPLGALCEHCSDSLTLGRAGERSIIDFWQKHSLIINRDNALDQLLMSIQCNVGSIGLGAGPSEPQALEDADESTPLLRSSHYVVAQNTSKYPLFFRAHHMISALHQNSFLRNSSLLLQYQHLMTNLRNFSYEAVQDMDDDAANDLMTLLGQVEPLIGQMAGIAAGRPKLDTLYHLKNLALNFPIYSLLGTAIITLFTTFVGGLYCLATCRDEEELLDAKIKIGATGAGVVFFVIVAIIYRNRCDPAVREMKKIRETHTHNV